MYSQATLRDYRTLMEPMLDTRKSCEIEDSGEKDTYL